MAPDRERRMFTNLDPRESNRLKALFLLRILEVVEDFAALSTDKEISDFWRFTDCRGRINVQL